MQQPRSELMRPGLPLWAAAFVVVACLTVVGLSAWHQWLAHQNYLESAEIEMANLARSLTQHADDTFDIADTIVNSLANRLEVSKNRSLTVENIQQFLQRPRDESRVRSIYIYDETGQRIATTEKADTVSANNADRDYFQHHLASPSRETYISRPLKSRVSGQWIVTVSRRFNHEDGSFAGVVAASIDVNYFANYYRQFDVGKNGAISLVNSDGIMLARSRDTEAVVGRDLSSSPIYSQRRRAAGGVVYVRSSIDGIERLCFYETSRRFPVMVVTTRDKNEVLASWIRETVVQILFVSALAAFIGLMGVHLIRRLMERQRLATALVAKEADFRLLAEQSSDVVMRIGADEKIVYASPSCTRILGWTPEELQGKHALGAVHEDDAARARGMVDSLMCGAITEGRMAYRKHHPSKGVIWLETALRATQHPETGAIDGIVGICRDVTEQKNIERELDTMARSDALTGLGNRRHFDELLAEEWARAKRNNTELGLLLIDVDHFKKYNDCYGHQAGDECLRTVALVIAHQAQRFVNLAARYGGEEFAVLLPDTDEDGCRRIADGIRNTLYRLNIEHAESELAGCVTVSIGGTATRPADITTDAHALVEQADAALYLAKNSGRNEVRVGRRIIPLETLRRRARVATVG